MLAAMACVKALSIDEAAPDCPDPPVDGLASEPRAARSLTNWAASASPELVELAIADGSLCEEPPKVACAIIHCTSCTPSCSAALKPAAIVPLAPPGGVTPDEAPMEGVYVSTPGCVGTEGAAAALCAGALDRLCGFIQGRIAGVDQIGACDPGGCAREPMLNRAEMDMMRLAVNQRKIHLHWLIG